MALLDCKNILYILVFKLVNDLFKIITKSFHLNPNRIDQVKLTMIWYLFFHNVIVERFQSLNQVIVLTIYNACIYDR